TNLDLVIAPEPVRLVPAQAAAHLKPILEIALVHRGGCARDHSGDGVERRRFAQTELLTIPARVIPEPAEHQVCNDCPAPDALPLRLPRAVESSLVPSRLPGDNARHVLDVSPPVEHGKGREPVGRVHLERFLVSGEPRFLRLDTPGDIRLAALEDAIVVPSLAAGGIEPQPVPDDLAAQISARVVPQLERG